jgi:nitroimidazol reductase NimA-like FMN-containing flavoprotein (pyridoxamine 5'-phosphate oxidase superfamily)
MPRPLTEHERQDFLAAPHVGVLSVASDNERPPLTAPIWYGYQPGGNLTFFTGTFGRKARKTELIRKAGVVSLSVQREEPPYRYVTVEGTVVQTDQPPAADQILVIARRYLPEEHAQGFVAAVLADPGSELVLFTVRPDRWLTADFSDDAG